MYYVYILRSLKQRGAIYKGRTKDLKKRLEYHNNEEGKYYSKRYSPWIIETYLAFSQSTEAKAFERYLKSSSGHAFLKKRLISEGFRLALEKFNNGRASTVSETE